MGAGENRHVHAGEIIAVEDCVGLAEQIVAADRHWHHHVLFPGCAHNVFEGYALVIEDDDEHRTYYAQTEQFPEVDKDLVRMLHGDDILDGGSTSAGTGAAVGSPLVQRARDLVASDAQWHHHMCFPAGLLHPAPGRWTIVVESGLSTWADSYDDEPIDVLREIEVLFFTSSA
jgi:hypothetical protein